MKKTLFFISSFTFIVAFNSSNLLAQKSPFHFEISHPIPIGNTFFSEYDGKLGIDLKYVLPVLSFLNLEGQLGYSGTKFSFLTSKNDDLFVSNTSGNIFRVIIGSSLKLRITEQISLVPNAGIGFAHMRFNNNDFNDRSSRNGYNTITGLSIDFQKWNRVEVGIFSSYHFIYLEKPEIGMNIPFSRELHFINSGIRLKYYN